MDELKKILRKISCALGYHKYMDGNMKTTLIGEDYNRLSYRVQNECIYCGHKYRETITVKMRNV